MTRAISVTREGAPAGATSRLGLYVHLPFCPWRCPYCAFAVVTGRQAEARAYVEAVGAEIARWAPLATRGGLDTVFLGGGTPTSLEPGLLAQLLEAADHHLGLRPGAEVTVEANPTTADTGRFTALRRAGCTRLSLGAQALTDASLLCLGRRHDAAAVIRAYGAARDAGFHSVNLDLIFSIPGATPGDWDATLERVVALAPDHVSTYALSVEAGTPFDRRRRAGDLPEVGEDRDAAQWELANQILVQAGFEHYEISNFARPGHRCRHNWDCWRGADYLGVGLSAHSCLQGRRFWNTADFDEYLSWLRSGRRAAAGGARLPPAAGRREALWLALRTAEGAALTAPEWRRLRGTALWQRLGEAGLARRVGARLVLTESGFAQADAIAVAVGDSVAPDPLPVCTGDGLFPEGSASLSAGGRPGARGVVAAL